MKATTAEFIEVQNVNHPGKKSRVGAAKYGAMREALAKALPKAEPGLTQKEMMDAVLPHLPNDLFPGGSTSGWWVKTVQLDLEAKGVMKRSNSSPTRWWAAKNF